MATRGKPPVFSNVHDLEAKIEEYFSVCDEGRSIEVYDKKRQEVREIKTEIPYTVPGLAYHLGFAHRKSLLDYIKKGDEYCNAITRAKLKIEMQRNERALMGEQEPRFAQFDLKNNFGWEDNQGINHSGGLTLGGLKDAIGEIEQEDERPGGIGEALESDMEVGSSLLDSE